MRKRRSPIKKKKQNRYSMALIVVVILMLVVVVSFKRLELKEKQQGYAKREEQLTEQIEEQKKRAEEIDEYEKYTKTKKYAEEVAKEKLGLVNENEIVFQSDTN